MSQINLRQKIAVYMGAIATATMITTTPVYANELTKVLTDVPLRLQLKALDNSWQRLTLNQESVAPAILFGMTGLIESALRTNVYYTQGNTVTLGEQQYLVVYRPEGSNISLTDLLQSSRKRPPESLGQALTPNSTIIPSLINLSQLGSLQDIQPFNLQKEIRESKQVLPKQPEKTKKLPSSPTPKNSPTDQ